MAGQFLTLFIAGEEYATTILKIREVVKYATTIRDTTTKRTSPQVASSKRTSEQLRRTAVECRTLVLLPQ
jgi:hypothetical protein